MYIDSHLKLVVSLRESPRAGGWEKDEVVRGTASLRTVRLCVLCYGADQNYLVW